MHFCFLNLNKIYISFTLPKDKSVSCMKVDMAWLHRDLWRCSLIGAGTLVTVSSLWDWRELPHWLRGNVWKVVGSIVTLPFLCFRLFFFTRILCLFSKSEVALVIVWLLLMSVSNSGCPLLVANFSGVVFTLPCCMSRMWHKINFLSWV